MLVETSGGTKTAFCGGQMFTEESGSDSMKCLAPVVGRILTGLSAVKRRQRGLGRANATVAKGHRSEGCLYQTRSANSRSIHT